MSGPVQRNEYEGCTREELIERLRAVDRTAREGPASSTRENPEPLHVLQDSLEEARRRYMDLYDFAPVGYLTLDAGGVVREINLTATHLLKTDRGRVLGRPMAAWIASDDSDRFVDHLRRCRDSNTPVRTELCIVTPGAAPRAVELYSQAYTPPYAERCYRTAIFDLTERKRAEEEHGRAERESHRREIEHREAQAASEAKDRFLAVLSHELRTPLTSVLLAMSELKYEVTTERALGLVNLATRNVQLEARLIDDLLDVTRIAQGKLDLRSEPIDCHEILESTLDLCECQIQNGEHTVHTAFNAERAFVLGDSTRLHQIFWNLVRNATQHSPPGGEIHVTTENRKDRLVVSIGDEGPGIPTEVVERLFKPFEQSESASREGGLGLGLTIARGLAEAHGGTIAVRRREPGPGTTFEISLPLTRESRRPAPPRWRPSRVTSKGPMILLVEDDPDTADLLASVLTRRGYRLQHAPDVRSALDAARNPVDVVVSDLGLPDGTGHDMLQRLRQTCSAPAIALSGYGGDEEVRRAKSAGFAAHVLKPTTADHLVDVIERIRTGQAGE